MTQKKATLESVSEKKRDRSLRFFEESPVGLTSFTEKQVAQIQGVITKHLRHDLGLSDLKANKIMRGLMSNIRPMSSEDNRLGAHAFIDFEGEESKFWVIYLGDVFGPNGGSIVHEVEHALAGMKASVDQADADHEWNWIPTTWQLLTDHLKLLVLEAFVKRFYKEDLAEPIWASAEKTRLEATEADLPHGRNSASDHEKQEQRLAHVCSKSLMHEYFRFFDIGWTIGQEEKVVINRSEIRINNLEEALDLADFLVFERRENYKIGFFVAGYIRGARDESIMSGRLAQLRKVTLAKICEY